MHILAGEIAMTNRFVVLLWFGPQEDGRLTTARECACEVGRDLP